MEQRHPKEGSGTLEEGNNTLRRAATHWKKAAVPLGEQRHTGTTKKKGCNTLRRGLPSRRRGLQYPTSAKHTKTKIPSQQ
jgi:hypothetical protein